jgi:hypothetical protein
MGDIIDFDKYTGNTDEPGREKLEAYLAQLQQQIALLDEQEPKNMDSEEYEAWGERHEELEDMVDDVLDMLDELDD